MLRMQAPLCAGLLSMSGFPQKLLRFVGLLDKGLGEFAGFSKKACCNNPWDLGLDGLGSLDWDENSFVIIGLKRLCIFAWESPTITHLHSSHM